MVPGHGKRPHPRKSAEDHCGIEEGSQARQEGRQGQAGRRSGLDRREHHGRVEKVRGRRAEIEQGPVTPCRCDIDDLIVRDGRILLVPGNSELDPKAGFTTVWQSLKFLDRLAVRVGHRRLPCISGPRSAFDVPDSKRCPGFCRHISRATAGHPTRLPAPSPVTPCRDCQSPRAFRPGHP